MNPTALVKRLLTSPAALARAADARLDIAHPILLEVDLHLVVLRLPVAHGGEPAEPPPVARDQALAAVDHRADLAGGQPLRREERHRVEELREGVGADDAGLAEKRVHRDIGRRDERARVRRRRTGAGNRSARPHRVMRSRGRPGCR